MRDPILCEICSIDTRTIIPQFHISYIWPDGEFLIICKICNKGVYFENEYLYKWKKAWKQ